MLIVKKQKEVIKKIKVLSFYVKTFFIGEKYDKRRSNWKNENSRFFISK